MRFRSAALAGLLPVLAFAPLTGLAQSDTDPNVVPPPMSSPPLPTNIPAPPPAVLPPPPPPMAAQGGPPGAGGGAVLTNAGGPSAQAYSPAQLDQMLAPIALYPDALLMQILMASTFPIQVVEAERWVQNPRNASIHGDRLVAVLDEEPWDPSVKSLVPFPQILQMMNDQLDWTQSLGNAFATQQADMMDRVQVLRAQAEAAGKLASTQQIKVVHEGPSVIIEPYDPGVIYVPVYNPVDVYGPWAYADYPPLYFAPPPGFYVGPVGIGIGFSVGFGVVGPLWGWGAPAWGDHNVVINNNAYTHISYHHAAFAGTTWHSAGPIHTVGAGFHGPGAGPFHAPGAAPGFHGPGGATPGFHGPTPAAGPHVPGAAPHVAPHVPTGPAGHTPGFSPPAHAAPSVGHAPYSPPGAHGPAPGGIGHPAAMPTAPHPTAAPPRAPAAAHSAPPPKNNNNHH